MDLQNKTLIELSDIRDNLMRELEKKKLELDTEYFEEITKVDSSILDELQKKLLEKIKAAKWSVSPRGAFRFISKDFKLSAMSKYKISYIPYNGHDKSISVSYWSDTTVLECHPVYNIDEGLSKGNAKLLMQFVLNENIKYDFSEHEAEIEVAKLKLELAEEDLAKAENNLIYAKTRHQDIIKDINNAQ